MDSHQKGHVFSPLPVPEIQGMPNAAPNDFNTVQVADYLVTAAIHHQPALLHTDFYRDAGGWFLQDASQNEKCIAQFDRLGRFRSVLARFGHHYMNDQLYGGHIRCMLIQKDDVIHCEIFMSNQQSTGYWLVMHIGKR